MSLNVELQVRARFGKSDGARDYAWLMAQEVVPRGLLALSETLSQVVANGKTFLSCVTEEGGELWLLRAYRAGMDNQFRPIAAAEVAQVVAPRPLPLAHWLGLAAISIQQPERDLIGEANNFSIAIPPAQSEPADPGVELLARARLGLPISTMTRVAASLLALDVFNYRGICFAVRGKNDLPPEWVPELAAYLCVNFSEAQLSPEEQELVLSVQRRPISPDEWTSLTQLGPEQARRALSWAAANNGPLRVSDSDSEQQLLRWLVAYRGGQLGGARLLSALRRDTTLQTLPPSFIAAATRGLPEEATTFLSAVARGERPDESLEVIELLAAEGFLEDEQTVPLDVWIGRAGRSPTLSERALRHLEARGCAPEAARFVLDLAPGSDPSAGAVPEGLAGAAHLAASLGLEPPRRRLLAALKSAGTGEKVRPLREAGRAYGGAAESLVRFWAELELPPPGALTPQEMLAAVEARAAGAAGITEFLAALSAFVRAERLTEAAELVEAAEVSAVVPLSPDMKQTLRARLGISPPAAPPPPAELSRLVTLELARPCDIKLPEGEPTQLAEYARLWQSTAALAEVLGEATGDYAETVPAYPSSWQAALRKAVTSGRSVRWLRRLDDGRREAARRWVAALHGLDFGALEFLSGGTGVAANGITLTPEWLDWLPVMFSSSPRAERLRAAATIARTGVLKGDEARATQLVGALLPEQGVVGRGVAIHALTGLGPLPPLDGLLAEFVMAWLPALDAAAVADAIFSSYDPALSGDAEFCRALAEALARREAACPAHGYTAEQLRRHALLAHALSGTRGWERVAPDVATRIRHARAIIGHLGLRPEDLSEPAEPGD